MACVGSSAGYTPTANTLPSAVVDGIQSIADIWERKPQADQSPTRESRPCEAANHRRLEDRLATVSTKPRVKA
eukprot:7086692-Pyramimonas_sp.AAC.1